MCIRDRLFAVKSYRLFAQHGFPFFDTHVCVFVMLSHRCGNVDNSMTRYVLIKKHRNGGTYLLPDTFKGDTSKNRSASVGFTTMVCFRKSDAIIGTYVSDRIKAPMMQNLSLIHI